MSSKRQGEGVDAVARTTPAGEALAATVASDSAAAVGPDVAAIDETLPSGPGEGSRAPAAGPALPTVARDRYVLVRELGRGGMGVVLEVRDRVLGRTVALKECSLADPGGVERFRREALLSARLEHPSIVSVHDAGRWPSGEPFYAMRLVRGRTLATLIDEARTLPERMALLPHALAIADALAYAHDQKVVHRDLKPGNVLVGKFGETVVVDWGLAKDLTATGGDDSLPPSKLVGAGETAVGALLGTPAYMAPEQARADKIDERVDVYAIGAILHQMLAGRAPHEADDVNQLVARLATTPAAPLATRVPELPEDLAAIVDRALAFRREDRYPSARELAAELRRYQAGQLVASHRYSTGALLRRWARRHRAPLVVASAALLILMVAFVISAWRIITERNRARREQRATQAAMEVAEHERRAADRRADELVVAQADAELGRDPTATLAMLAQLSPSSQLWEHARVLAADAVSRGRSRVWGRDKNAISEVIWAPDGGALAVSATQGAMMLFDADGRLVLAPKDVPVYRVAWTPDGKRLYGAALHKGIVGWTRDGQPLPALARGRDEARTLAISADGTTMVVGALGRIEVLDLTGAAEARTVTVAQLGAVEELQVSDDGRFVLSVDAPLGALDLIDTQSGGRKRLLDGGADAARMSPSGQRVVASDDAGVVRVWTQDRGFQPRALGGRAVILDLRIAGDRIFGAGLDGAIRVWSFEGPAEPEVLAGHAGAVQKLAPSDDGRWLASAAVDGARLLDRNTGAVIKLNGHRGAVLGLSRSNSGRIATSGLDGTVRVWDIDGARHDVREGPPGAHVIARAPDGAWAVGGSRGEIRVFPASGGAPVILTGHTASVLRLVFRGSELLSGSGDGTVRLWDVAAGTSKVLGSGTGGSDLALSSDGKSVLVAREAGAAIIDLGWNREEVIAGSAPFAARVGFLSHREIVSASSDGQITTHDLASGTTTAVAKLDLALTALAVAERGSAFAASGAREVLVIQRGAQPGTLSLGAPEVVTGMAFSPEGRYLAMAGSKDVRLFDRTLGKEKLLVGHLDRTRALAFSPDGSQLASGDVTGVVRIWLHAGDISRELRGHGEVIADLQFLADRVVSCSHDGTLRLWRDDLPRGPEGLRPWLATVTK